MIEWPIAAAREAGAGRIVVVDGPKRALADALPEGVEVAIQEEPNGTGDAVRSAADHIGADDTVLVLYGDVPLITAEAIDGARARPRGERRRGHDGDDGARGPARLRPRRARRRRRRRARGGDQDARRRDARGGGDPRGQHRHLRVRGRRPARRRSTQLDAPTTPRASSTCPTCCRSCAPTARRSAPTWSPTRRSRSASTPASSSPQVRRARPGAHPRARTRSPASRSSTRPSTLIDAGVEIGRDTIVEPGTFLRGATRIGARCEVGPLTTLIDTVAGDDTRIVHSYLHGAELGSGVSRRPVRLPAPAGARCATRPRPARSWRSRTPRSARARRCRTSPTSATPTSAPARNIGAGTITANYDGANKHRTTIGARRAR